MTSQDENPNSACVEKTNPTLVESCKNCWKRLKVWNSWVCDAEGPSAINIIRNTIFRWIFGVILFLLGVGLIVLTIPFADKLFNMCSYCNNSTEVISCLDFCRYLGFGLVLTSSTFYVIGSHAKKLELKTGVYNEEIDNLIREVRVNLDSPDNNDALKANITSEIRDLDYYKEMPSEVSFLRLIALRKLHVDTCHEYEELKALAESDLGDYTNYVGDDHQKFIMYRNAFDSLYREHDRTFNTDIADKVKPLIIKELKTHIKELRDELQWEKFYAGQGEAIVKSVTHWSLIAITSLLMLGITPLLHVPMLQSELNIVHWWFLGMAGAVIYTASTIRARDTSELGFEEGSSELRKMLLGIVIGGISAILLYAAIRSGVFGGKILPRFNFDEAHIHTKEVIGNNLLSIFWAVTAGYSVKFLDRLLGFSEKTVST